MSKRFTETMKWDNLWFRNLSADKKLVWLYLCDKCDNAGVWKTDYAHATFCIGTAITQETILALNDDKLRAKLLNGGSLFFLTEYVEFQIGDIAVFSVSQNATNLQKNCIATIRKYMQKGLLTEEDYGLATGTLPVSYPSATGISNSKGNSKSNSEGDCKGDDYIAELRAIYTWIDLDTEIAKMKGWLTTPKGRGRQLTKKFMVNWLNKLDKPIDTAIKAAPSQGAQSLGALQMQISKWTAERKNIFRPGEPDSPRFKELTRLIAEANRKCEQGF